MVPKADSGTFLLLFLLVLSITEPLRPGTGPEKGRGAGRGRLSPLSLGVKGCPRHVPSCDGAKEERLAASRKT